MFLTALIAPTSLAQSELYPEHFNLEEVVLKESPLFTAMERNFKLFFTPCELKFDGKCLCKGIAFSAARDSLPHGIYIIGGKKIIF